MSKIDATVKRETKYILLFVLLFSAVMEAVFLIINKWDITVLFGNMLGGLIAVLNFFLLGITLQKAVKQDEKDVKSTVKASQTIRMFMLIVTAALGYSLPCFNVIAVLVPLFFPRLAIALRPIIDKKRESKKSGKGDEQ